MFILPRIIYNLFLWVCWEWGLSVSLERQKENKTGEKEKRGREEERQKKKNDYLRDTLYNTSSCTSHSVSWIWPACCFLQPWVQACGWDCLEEEAPFSSLHENASIWDITCPPLFSHMGISTFKKCLGPCLAVQWSGLHLQVKGMQVQSMVAYASPPKIQMIKQKQYGN